MATLAITFAIAGIISVQAYFDTRAIGKDIHNIYTRHQTTSSATPKPARKPWTS